jgi:hypothetical protein
MDTVHRDLHAFWMNFKYNLLDIYNSEKYPGINMEYSVKIKKWVMYCYNSHQKDGYQTAKNLRTTPQLMCELLYITEP